jgi:hypothetical protein
MRLRIGTGRIGWVRGRIGQGRIGRTPY